VRRGGAGLRVIKRGGSGAKSQIGKGVGSRARQRGRSARDCSAGLLSFLGYARALRGEEITKIELSGVRKYFGDDATEPQHVTLSLVGRFKQEEEEQQHFIPVTAMTVSGLQIREWVECLLKEKEMTGVISGFMFLRNDGTPARAPDFEEC
jgi:hypothetical protein